MTRDTHFNRRQALYWMGAAAAGTWGVPMGAMAQAAAVDTLKIVLGSPAGSALDHMCRRVGEALKGSYAQNVIVDNRTGASGQLAVTAVKAAAPDGTTILVTPSPHVAIYPFTYKKLPYNPDTDLVPVSTAADIDIAYAVGPMVPASVTNLKEYFAWCKANPDKAAFGSPAAGSSPHFIGSMVAKAAGVEVQHVAYRGPSPAVVDMVGGQISAAISALGDFTQFAAAGKCRVLATTGLKRTKYSPAVPTYAEQGFKEFSQSDWFGIFMPAGTPPALVQRLNAALKTALNDKAVEASLDERAMDARWSSTQDFVARIQADKQRWAPIVKAMNFTADT